MIARIVIPIIFVLVLPNYYIYRQHLSSLSHTKKCWRTILLCLPEAVLLLCSAIFAFSPDFIPHDIPLFEIYLAALAFYALPKFVFCICLFITTKFHYGKSIGVAIGIVMTGLIYYIGISGCLSAYTDFRVRRIDIFDTSLPDAFDGYKIVQFSDLHIGTFTGPHRIILDRAIDSIMSQHANVIVFTGDFQNMSPDEVDDRHVKSLSRLNAPDGVLSILGNHDYGQYVKCSDEEKRKYEKRLVELQESLGWKVLQNSNVSIQRGRDSIVIAGEGNDGEPPYPNHSNIKKTLAGIDNKAFIILLQHDPSSWKRTILPKSNVQLTLSGHTHGGQMNIFGFRPTMLKYSEDLGLYNYKDRQLHVSSGVGGVVPFRFQLPGEIVAITLRKKR